MFDQHSFPQFLDFFPAHAANLSGLNRSVASRHPESRLSLRATTDLRGRVAVGGGGVPAPQRGAAEGLLALPPLLHLLQLRLLVALLQVLHEDGHHHVDQHELRRQHKGDEVDGRDQRQVGEAVAVLRSAVAQRVLNKK